jgi:hypothetical protein
LRYDLRFWAEFISPPEIVEQALPLLSEFSAGVSVAVPEGSLSDENAKAFRDIKAAGVELTFWPLLGREKGYFPNEANVPAFTKMVHELIEWAEGNGALPDMVAFDLELPLEQIPVLLGSETGGGVKRTLDMLSENLNPQRYREARSGLIELNSRIRSRGMRTIAAVLPWVALELFGDGEIIQDLMETPVAGIDWDLISPMLYVSMFEGMTGGRISAFDANSLVYEAVVRLRNKYGGRAAVSLGVTGKGVLGNEPTFETVEDLMVGVEASLAAGARDISIYNLEGLVSRPNPRSWLEALRGARPRVPERSVKTVRILCALRNLYPAVSRLQDKLS